MNDDDVLCDNRGPDGLRCTMPMNHGGATHHYEVELPPFVATLVAEHVDELDKHIEKLKRTRIWLMVAAGFNILCGLWSLAALFLI